MFAILGKGKWLVRRFPSYCVARGISVLNRKLKWKTERNLGVCRQAVIEWNILSIARVLRNP